MKTLHVSGSRARSVLRAAGERCCDCFRNLFVLSIITIICFSGVSQTLENRYPAWYIPSPETNIHGLAIGPFINTFNHLYDDTLTTTVNGLALEIFGIGFWVPLVPSDPFEAEDSISVNRLISDHEEAVYRVNGLMLSPAGLGGHDVHVNGLNLSGINTLTGKVNGISTGMLFGINALMNGISISGLNSSVRANGLQIGLLATKYHRVNGLQIGLFNRSGQLRGFQIGLWNKNGKRSLPIINWSFGKRTHQ